MGLLDSFGTLFDPKDAAEADQINDGINSTIKGPQWAAAGNLGLGTSGSAGNDALQQTYGLGNTQVGANFTGLDQNAAGATNLASVFSGLAANGGAMEAAARQQGIADLARTSQGKMLDTSQQVAGNIGNVAAQERYDMSNEATGNKALAAMMALRKATMMAAITHQNIQTGMAATGLRNTLNNQQVSNDQAKQQAANAAANGQFAGGFQMQGTTNQIGNSVLQGILGATSNGIATLASSQATKDANGSTSLAGNDTGPYGTSTAGYSMPAISTSAKFALPNPYLTSDTTSSMPADKEAWAMGSTLAGLA